MTITIYEHGDLAGSRRRILEQIDLDLGALLEALELARDRDDAVRLGDARQDPRAARAERLDEALGREAHAREVRPARDALDLPREHRAARPLGPERLVGREAREEPQGRPHEVAEADPRRDRVPREQ